MDLKKVKLEELKSVGKKTAQYLNKLDIYNLEDLLNFYPRTYEFWEYIENLDFINPDKVCCVKIKIISNYVCIKTSTNKIMYKIQAQDINNNILNIIFFNSKFAAQKLMLNNFYLIMGKFKKNTNNFEVISPKTQEFNQENLNNIVPIYNQNTNITSNKISKLIKNQLNLISEKFPETLPNSVIINNNLCSRDFCIRNIHSPDNKTSLKIARERLVFEEFFVYYLRMESLKNYSKQKTDINILNTYFKEFCELLKFKLTESQEKVIFECFKDMLTSSNNNLSMNRLLQGDVGSGKTVIAAALMYMTVRNNYQAVLMAPTELLAVQHYNNFCELFKNTSNNIQVKLLVGSSKNKYKKNLLQEISLKNNNFLIIGTHSLISDNVNFANLGLVVTDEQHRFGVNQRAKLVNKSKNSTHVLVMSATPIPRTLAMIMYGDLDVSVLDQVIPGRQKIETFVINSQKRERMFNFVRETISKNQQVYIVCSSIEEIENKNNIIYLEYYKNMLIEHNFNPDIIEILHGKMNPYEKDKIMEKFSDNITKILISTTVIEVGIDVPNATLIIIENAERFGLAQLHQLRGRVGRGDKKSYCILVSDSKSKDSSQRFLAMKNSSDGFFLSEQDLKIRGPGDFFGTNQHGVPNIKIPTNYSDIVTIQKSHDYVRKIISKNIINKNPEFNIIKDKLYQNLDIQNINL